MLAALFCCVRPNVFVATLVCDYHDACNNDYYINNDKIHDDYNHINHDHYNDEWYYKFYYHDDYNDQTAHRNVTPADLDNASAELDELRGQGIRHYGLLTVLAFPEEFSVTILSMKSIIQRLKEIQGADPTAKTVLAIGCYDFKYPQGYFVPPFAEHFTNVAK
ncbi:hypothetical protein MTO96_036526 [Rhipicephalus appendiculatus]